MIFPVPLPSAPGAAGTTPYYPQHHLWTHLDVPALPHRDRSLLPGCALAVSGFGVFLTVIFRSVKTREIQLSFTAARPGDWAEQRRLGRDDSTFWMKHGMGTQQLSRPSEGARAACDSVSLSTDHA